jgi:hypothetical protein
MGFLQVEFELDVGLEACVCSGAKMMSFALMLKSESAVGTHGSPNACVHLNSNSDLAWHIAYGLMAYCMAYVWIAKGCTRRPNSTTPFSRECWPITSWSPLWETKVLTIQTFISRASVMGSDPTKELAIQLIADY